MYCIRGFPRLGIRMRGLQFADGRILQAQMGSKNGCVSFDCFHLSFSSNTVGIGVDVSDLGPVFSEMESISSMSSKVLNQLLPN